MIQTLNQTGFQPFGTLVREGEKPWGNTDRAAGRIFRPEPEAAKLFRAAAATWLNVRNGVGILSVSSDGKNYCNFYLDRSVCIKSGVYFCILPFQGNCTVELLGEALPEATGSRENRGVRIEKKIRVEGLYSFTFQEKEQGFLFSGGSQPVPELVYVEQGSLHSITDGQDLLLEQGDLVIYGANQWHMQYADVGVAPRLMSVSFDFDDSDLKPLLNQKITASQPATHLLKEMIREQRRMDAYCGDILIAQLNLLVLTLLRQAEADSNRKHTYANIGHGENEIIRQAQIFISTHIREKLSVPVVARQVDVSPSYLTALFHKNLQISPGEYIRRVKLQESKRMIRENTLNFTEIASALQYSTVHHFSRQFKEKFGITPTEYAKTVR